ncbi:MAG: GtrA family protein [Actinomycetia bacterium]|nr:GtrA family protein [Actinomycetes bacterium]
MTTSGVGVSDQVRALVQRLRRGAGELSRFGAVGIGAFVIDVGLFNLLVHVGDPGPLADKPLTAKTIATVVATIFAYQVNREWTWKDRGRRGFWREYSLYFLLNAIGLVITLLPLAVSRYVLDLDSAIADNISANVIGVGFGTLFRFSSYRRWVFPAVEEEPKVGGSTTHQGESATD